MATTTTSTTPKEASTFKRVAFTYNFENEDDAVTYALAPHPDVERAVWQIERGDSGNLHAQGFFRLTEGVTWRLNRAKKYAAGDRADLRAHIESAKGTDGDNWLYCTDDGKRVLGAEPQLFGQWEGHKEGSGSNKKQQYPQL